MATIEILRSVIVLCTLSKSADGRLQVFVTLGIRLKSIMIPDLSLSLTLRGKLMGKLVFVFHCRPFASQAAQHPLYDIDNCLSWH